MPTKPDPVVRYARKIAKPTASVGALHRRAGIRFLEDLKRTRTDDAFPFVFDRDRADRALLFFSTLKHYKGQWSGSRLQLEPFQQFILANLYGWIDPATGFRRFRSAYIEVPRKNGKSFLAAGVLLYTTFFTGEAGAEGYACGVKRDQARIVFDDCKAIVQQDAMLKKRIRVFVSNLARLDTRSKIEPLSSDYNSLDGLNPSAAVIDEYHAHKTRGLVDVIETAQGARREPLLFAITTAGVDLLSPCAVFRDYVRQILDGTLSDDRLFGFIAHADPEDNPFLVRTWKKANPMWGVSVNPEDMRRLAKQAKAVPSALAMFRTKRLNQWVEGGDPWLNLERWRAGQSDRRLSPATFAGRSCCIGVDLASKIDLAAAAIVFKPTDADPKWRILPKFWTPDADLDAREHAARAPYQEWIRSRDLQRIPGARIDQQYIREYLFQACRDYDVQLIGLDPWNAASLIADLQREIGDGRVVEIPQTVGQLSDPSKEFEALILEELIDAGSCPVLTWMVGNAVVKVDANGNIFPSKARARGHIDGVIASILAIKLARYADADAAATVRSVYEDRGLLTL